MNADERALAQDILDFVTGLFPGGSAVKIPAKFFLSRMLPSESNLLTDQIDAISSGILSSLKEYSYEFNLKDPARLPQAIEAFRYSLTKIDLSAEQLISHFGLEAEPLADALVEVQFRPGESSARDALRRHITREFAIRFMEIVPKLPGFVWPGIASCCAR